MYDILKTTRHRCNVILNTTRPDATYTQLIKVSLSLTQLIKVYKNRCNLILNTTRHRCNVILNTTRPDATYTLQEQMQPNPTLYTNKCSLIPKSRPACCLSLSLSPSLSLSQSLVLHVVWQSLSHTYIGLCLCLWGNHCHIPM